MDRKPDAEVMFFVELTNLCESFHCLPSQLLAEDSYLMGGIVDVVKARAERRQVRGASQHKGHPDRHPRS
jgi:hypothetical protein